MATKKQADAGLIRLPQQAVEDITDLIKHRAQIRDIIGLFAGEKPASSLASFSFRIAAKGGLDTTVVTEIALSLWNMKNLQRRYDTNGKALVNMLTKASHPASPRQARLGGRPPPGPAP